MHGTLVSRLVSPLALIRLDRGTRQSGDKNDASCQYNYWNYVKAAAAGAAVAVVDEWFFVDRFKRWLEDACKQQLINVVYCN